MAFYVKERIEGQFDPRLCRCDSVPNAVGTGNVPARVVRRRYMSRRYLSSEINLTATTQLHHMIFNTESSICVFIRIWDEQQSYRIGSGSIDGRRSVTAEPRRRRNLVWPVEYLQILKQLFITFDLFCPIKYYIFCILTFMFITFKSFITCG